jgi:hypothetical protein
MPLLPINLATLAATSAAGAVLYGAIVYFLGREMLAEIVQYVREIIGGTRSNREECPARQPL